MLIDKGLTSHINKFELRMQAPTTQEDIDRRDNTSSKVQIASDIMNLTADIEDPITKLKMLKALLTNVISDTEVVQLIQEEIDRLESESTTGTSDIDTGEDDMSDLSGGDGGMGDFDSSAPLDLNDTIGNEPDMGDNDSLAGDELDIDMEADTSTDTDLPNPADLNVDFTANT